MFVCLASFCMLYTPSNKVMAEDSFITITSLDAITDMQGKYRLAKQDEPYTFTKSISGTFKGTLDGNGSEIMFSASESLNFVGTQALFENIGSNAVVYNLKFTPKNNFIQNYYFGTTKEADLKTSYGLLANTISGATIYGIEFSNLAINIFDNPNLIAISELNVGFLAGQVSGSKINQI